MQIRVKVVTLPSFKGPFTRDEFDFIEQNYPTASDAEKYRLMQAQRWVEWMNRQPVPKRRRAKAR